MAERKKMNTPIVWTHSGIDGNGQEYINIAIQRPEVIDDCYQNGKYLTFEINHIKQSTECWLQHDGVHGKTVFDGVVKRWKDEVLVESECMAFAKEYVSK